MVVGSFIPSMVSIVNLKNTYPPAPTATTAAAVCGFFSSAATGRPNMYAKPTMMLIENRAYLTMFAQNGTSPPASANNSFGVVAAAAAALSAPSAIVPAIAASASAPSAHPLAATHAASAASASVRSRRASSRSRVVAVAFDRSSCRIVVVSRVVAPRRVAVARARVADDGARARGVARIARVAHARVGIARACAAPRVVDVARRRGRTARRRRARSTARRAIGRARAASIAASRPATTREDAASIAARAMPRAPATKKMKTDATRDARDASGAGRGRGARGGRGGRGARGAKNGARGTAMEARGRDARGSSTASTRDMGKEMRERVVALRNEHKFYAVQSFCETFEAMRMPRKDGEAWERALCEPREHVWIVDFFLRAWAPAPSALGHGETLLVPRSWEIRSRRKIREILGEDVDDEAGFFDIDALSRLEVLYRLCEDLVETYAFSNVAEKCSDEFDKARRRNKVEQLQACKRGVHGEPIGYDSKGRAYYVSALDARICRAENVAADAGAGARADPLWSTPFVTLPEVIEFINALKNTTNKKELALREYLMKDHVPFHQERLKQHLAELERVQARSDARARAEEQRIAWENTARKKSSRLEVKKALENQRAERKVESISSDELETVLDDLRRWILLPESMRATAQPPHGVRVSTLYGEHVGGLDTKPVVAKPKGRRWVGYFVSVLWEDDNPSSEASWSDGYCVSYDSDTSKHLVIYPATATVERVNLETISVRLGSHSRKYDVGVDKKGRVLGDHAALYAALKPELDAARTSETYFSGCWRDDVVGNGIPVDPSRVGACGAVLLDAAEAPAEEAQDTVVEHLQRGDSTDDTITTIEDYSP